MSISDERIRELCQQVISAEDDFTAVMAELRAALRDRFGDIANKNAAIILNMPQLKQEPISEKKKADPGLTS